MVLHNVLLLQGLILAGLLSAAGCASGPQVESTSRYRAGMLRREGLLILPIATSSELGDKRSGIVLRDESVINAYKVACEQAREAFTDVVVHCVYDPSVRQTRPAMRALMLDFALDRPTKGPVLTQLSSLADVRYVLLFRPEGVRAAKTGPAGTQRSLDDGAGVVAAPAAASVGQAAVHGAIQGFGAAMLGAIPADRGSTSRGYTISAVIVDLKNGSALRYGVHSAEATEAGVRYPEPAPILAQAMGELAEALVDE